MAGVPMAQWVVAGAAGRRAAAGMSREQVGKRGTRMPTQVQDVMTTEVVVAHPTAPVKQVAGLLADHGLSRVQDWLTFELDDTGLQPSSSNHHRI
jgi:CBS-domain-containing membrane protein